jgi:16S rRNA (cytidine1402-2'-O)-methyltransferase
MNDVADKPLAPGLYLVATPIGNLEDISLRALRVLRSVDRIACEDTRQTAKLLGHFGISTSTVSYHAHNEGARAAELIEALRGGARIAVVSDAGTPGIADPGAVLAAQAIAAGVDVFPIPGANAALSALIASGLSAESFTFHGFLPAKEGARRSALENVRSSFAASAAATTHVFYEAPHRILATLEEVVAVFGAAQRIAIGRELTKLHEEFVRGTAGEVLSALNTRASVRGEIVLLVDGTPALTLTPHGEEAHATLAVEVSALMRKENLPEKEALKRVAKARGLSKSEAYRELQRTQQRKR